MYRMHDPICSLLAVEISYLTKCAVCEKVQGKLCRSPRHLRYSIEALGGDVESCLQHYFHIPVLWGRNGTAPDYLVLVGGLLTK